MLYRCRIFVVALVAVSARPGVAQPLALGGGAAAPAPSSDDAGRLTSERRSKGGAAARVATRSLMRSGGAARDSAAAISAESVRGAAALPIAGGEGPLVLRAQILLDAAGFGPGVLHGRWDENTVFAVRAFRVANALPWGDEVDDATWARLTAAAGQRDPLTAYALTRADVRGPYRRLPKGVYAKARLDCLCYESLAELLAERFHTTPDVLRALNPGVDLGRAAEGTVVHVPSVAGRAAREMPARLLVDRREGSLRGVDSTGRTLFWIPASVGSDAEPSPRGRLRVLSVTRNPYYHFNPRVLGDIPDSQADAHLPPGPNSPVGLLWVQLSKAHVGIHGTPDPAAVGYAPSHGCVRVTNWDGEWLAGIIRPGMVVEFR